MEKLMESDAIKVLSTKGKKGKKGILRAYDCPCIKLVMSRVYSI